MHHGSFCILHTCLSSPAANEFDNIKEMFPFSLTNKIWKIKNSPLEVQFFLYNSTFDVPVSYRAK